MFRRAITLIFCVLLSGCQLWQPSKSTEKVALESGVFTLLDSWPHKKQQLIQQVTWQNDKEQHQFLLTALLSRDGLLFVALSPLGQELWRLHYLPKHQLQLSGVAPFNDARFAMRLLAEMQLALLSKEHIENRLQHLTLHESTHSREIKLKNGDTLLHISPYALLDMNTPITIKAKNYQLTITTLQQDFLP